MSEWLPRRRRRKKEPRQNVQQLNNWHLNRKQQKRKRRKKNWQRSKQRRKPQRVQPAHQLPTKISATVPNFVPSIRVAFQKGMQRINRRWIGIKMDMPVKHKQLKVESLGH